MILSITIFLDVAYCSGVEGPHLAKVRKHEFQLILSREVFLIENSSNHISQITAHVDFTNFLLFRCRLLFWRRRPPTWQKADLRMTRVKDTDKNELLIFKELSWQTVRIEAKSTMSEDLTPLRLITNQARCRITIKKKLSGKIREMLFNST